MHEPSIDRHQEMLLWKISFKFFECKCAKICWEFPIRFILFFCSIENLISSLLPFTCLLSASFFLWCLVIIFYLFSRKRQFRMVSMIGDSVYQFFVMKTYVAAKLVWAFPSPHSQLSFFLFLAFVHKYTSLLEEHCRWWWWWLRRWWLWRWGKEEFSGKMVDELYQLWEYFIYFLLIKIPLFYILHTHSSKRCNSTISRADDGHHTTTTTKMLTKGS